MPDHKETKGHIELANHPSYNASDFPDVEGTDIQTLHHAPELVHNMTTEYRERAERLLRRKIDLRVLPMIILMYIMNYLDRNNIAAARLAGLEDDLGLSSVQYSVCSTFLTLQTLPIEKMTKLIVTIDLRQHPFCRVSPDAGTIQLAA